MPEFQRPTAIGPVPTREPGSGAGASDGRLLEKEIDLRWYARAIQRRWRWMVLGAVVGGAIAFAVATMQPVVYESVTTLLIVAPAESASVDVNPARFRTILEGVSLASQVVSELGLSRPPDQLTPQSFLERALTVEAPAGTKVIRVRVALSDANLAANASRRLAQKAVGLVRDLDQQEVTVVQSQFKQHLDDAAERMRAADQALLDYQQHAQVDVLEQDTKAMLGQRGELLKLLISIESEKARLAAAEAEIKQQDRLLSVPRALGAEEAVRRTDKTTDVLDSSNPYINPVYQSLEFQIASSRTSLAALERERAEVVDKRKLGADEFAKLSELYRRQIELARLQTGADVATKIYSDLAVRYEESRTQALGSRAQLQIVDEAIPADRPMSRRRPQFLALGLASGFLIAGIIAVASASRVFRFRP